MSRINVMLLSAILCACGAATPRAQPPLPTAESAPSLRGATAMVFPVQNAGVPVRDAQQRRWAADRTAIDAEIAYWLQQGAPGVKWVLPAQIDRTIARSPMLDIDPRALAVGVFQHAQVKRIGDPLFGDLARLAAVLQAKFAVVPVAAEFVGTSPDSAVLNIATAVIDPTDGDVMWFGVIAGTDMGVGSGAAVASAAQSFARAFAGRQPAGDNKQ